MFLSPPPPVPVSQVVLPVLGEVELPTAWCAQTRCHLSMIFIFSWEGPFSLRCQIMKKVDSCSWPHRSEVIVCYLSINFVVQY